MASALVDFEEFNGLFEKWLLEKLKTYNQDTDESLVTYMCSLVNDDDSTDDDKKESIEPILEELNQNSSFDQSQLAQEIVENWHKMREEYINDDSSKKNFKNTEPDSLATISDMIKKHELKTEVKKKSTENNFIADYGDDDDEKEERNVASLAQNTNTADAMAVEKAKRDKIAEVHKKKKDQTKKALIEQREKEEERKKKAKEKVAKVERKR